MWPALATAWLFGIAEEGVSHFNAADLIPLANLAGLGVLCIWLVVRGVPNMQKVFADQLDAERASQQAERALERAENRDALVRFTASLAEQEKAHRESEDEQRRALHEVVSLLQELRK
jgi:hypothetical protein